MTDEPLDRIAKDGFVAERTTFYAALYPRLREVARQHGYALALHGSLVRDLDLIAVPWVEKASPEDVLLVALVEELGGMVLQGGRYVDGAWEKAPVREQRPHGRSGWTIHLGSNGGYIDLAVMPRIARGGP